MRQVEVREEEEETHHHQEEKNTTIHFSFFFGVHRTEEDQPLSHGCCPSLLYWKVERDGSSRMGGGIGGKEVSGGRRNWLVGRVV